MATITGRNKNGFRQCQVLNEKSNYSCPFRSPGELRMIVRGAGVKGDLQAPALETSSTASVGLLASCLAPGEDVQACDNGSSMGLKSNLAGLTSIKQGGVYSLISEPWSCSMRTIH